jgi:hypothetical protein
VQLPADEEDDEEVVAAKVLRNGRLHARSQGTPVPELLEVVAASLLHGEPSHDG